MAFKVPESKASIKQNVFEFQLPGHKKTFSVPKLEYMSAELVERLGDFKEYKPGEEVSDEDGRAMFKLQNDIFRHYCPEALSLDTEQAAALFAAWSEGSEVDVGESSASEKS